MKRSLKYIIAAAILLVSCGKEESKHNIPDAPVNFIINPATGLDTHLNSGGNIGIYIKSKDKEAYDKLIRGVTVAKSYIAERTASSLVGYSGLLVVNIGILGDKPFAAFDLCCPNEARQNIRIVPTNEVSGRCPECGSTFSLLDGTGRPLSGPAEKDAKFLKPYYVERLNENEYRIFY
ncbi:hypothetical protein [Dysgonomonas sp. 511]|uniref:hypothetical protein n=1 Tax=Dysgonomonas sp. 511 TaxID=2302930 RepID=UPI0013D425A0|nr:hypothetical protein [Dysgonomonas sp. 511]NDV79597.1 hypothetical protein [Dysgonomonas sp. 511]